ncbi:MAG: efflux RND transporter permease subunit [Planctomycetota bacterium]
MNAEPDMLAPEDTHGAFGFVVRRPILFGVIALAVVVGGVFAFLNLKVDLLPAVNLPNVSVVVINPGMSAADVEERITRKLERAFSDLGGLDHVKSISREGVSDILVEFKYGERDIDAAAIEVQRRINEVRDELPATIEEPVVRKLDPAARPVMTLTLSAEKLGLRDLREFGENRVKRRIETIDNVAKVIVNGGLLRQINILADRDKLASYGLSLDHVWRTLKYSNANIPAGELKREADATSVVARTIAQYETLDAIRDTVIATINGVPITVGDVAKVDDGHKEPRGYATLNGTPAVTLEVKKQTGTNTVEISNAVRAEVEAIRRTLPPGMTLVIARDDADFIKKAISGISNAAWQGFALAFIALFLLLGTGRPSVVITVCVPASIIGTFLVMWLGGMTINMVTLYALTISIGVNFDASVVVLENIFRHMQAGKKRLAAAAAGTRELAAPLLASTLTNVIVFLPLTQLKGYIGELMRAMATTAIFAQVMALPVALFVVSNLTPRVIPRAPEGVTRIPVLRWVALLTTSALDLLGRLYTGLLRWCLRRSLKVTAAIFALFAVSLGLAPLIGVEFMPRTDQNAYFVDAETPVDTTLAETKAVAADIQKVLDRHKDAIEYSVISVGGDEPASPPPNKLAVSLKLKPIADRELTAVDSGDTSGDLISLLRSEIAAEVPGIAHVQFVQPAPWWGSAGAPIELKLLGYDWELLNSTADKYVRALGPLAGVFDVQKNTRPGRAEYQCFPYQKKMNLLGLQSGALAEALRLAIHGGDTSRYRTELRTGALFRDRDIYVVTRYAPEFREDADDLRLAGVLTPSGKAVNLGTVAAILRREGPGFISKEDKRRSVTVLVQTSNEPLNELVFKRVLPAVGAVELPEGVEMKMTGEVTRMNDQFFGMSVGFAIAFIFVAFVLAGQFESFIQPLVMLAAIPVMMIGVLLALFLTGHTLNTTSGNGIFALMGVVVNASVIIISTINQLRLEGMKMDEAILAAGGRRLRPILLTVSTTFFAMLPMAISRAEGADVYKPLAIAFMGGLVTSTILTLLLVPLLYRLLVREKAVHHLD